VTDLKKKSCERGCMHGRGLSRVLGESGGAAVDRADHFVVDVACH